jgi:hypothetical protein
MCNECLIKARDEMDLFIKANDLPWAKEYFDDKEHFNTLIKQSTKLERNLKKYFKQLAPKVIAKIDWVSYEKALNGK